MLIGNWQLWLMLAVPTIALIATVGRILSLDPQDQRCRRLVRAAWAQFVIVTLLWLVRWVAVSDLNESLILTADGQISGHIPANHYYLSFGLPLGTIQTYDPSDDLRQETVGSVSLLVNDSVIRKISYRLQVRVGQSDKAYSLAVGRFGRLAIGNYNQVSGVVGSGINDRLASFLKSLNDDFNQQWSDQLKRFFNPEDPKQQSAFATVMHAALDAKLAALGLELTAATFSVE